MKNPRVAGWCRVVANVFIISSIFFLLWSIYDVQAQRAQKPPYYDPENDMGRIVTNYLRVMGGVGAGCVFLWLGSCLSPKNK